MKNVKYVCEKCGKCCKYVDKMLESSHIPNYPYNIELKNFPYKAKEDGSCEKYDNENNICKIYKNRPTLCNIEKMYKKYFKKEMTKEEYFKRVKEQCKKLKLL